MQNTAFLYYSKKTHENIAFIPLNGIIHSEVTSSFHILYIPYIPHISYIFPIYSPYIPYTLCLFHIAMENHHGLIGINRYSNHLFLWTIYTMAMLVITRGYIPLIFPRFSHIKPLIKPPFLVDKPPFSYDFPIYSQPPFPSHPSHPSYPPSGWCNSSFCCCASATVSSKVREVADNSPFRKARSPWS